MESRDRFQGCQLSGIDQKYKMKPKYKYNMYVERQEGFISNRARESHLQRGGQGCPLVVQDDISDLTKNYRVQPKIRQTHT